MAIGIDLPRGTVRRGFSGSPLKRPMGETGEAEQTAAVLKAIEPEGAPHQPTHWPQRCCTTSIRGLFPRRTATAERRRAHPQWPISRSFSRKWRVAWCWPSVGAPPCRLPRQ